MWPSSRFAFWLKPSVVYFFLNFLMPRKKEDDLAVPGIRGHPVPGCGGEGGCAGPDDGMEPPAHAADGTCRPAIFPARRFPPPRPVRAPGWYRGRGLCFSLSHFAFPFTLP